MIERTKNIPGIERVDAESLNDYLGRIAEFLSKLEWQSEGHRMWYTHKNPYSCWICELLQVARRLESELMDIRDSAAVGETVKSRKSVDLKE